MNTPKQLDFPLDLLGILGAGKDTEGLATAGTLSLVFGKIVNRLHRREVVAMFSSVALGARLLASFASRFTARLRRICGVGVAIKGWSRIRFAGVGLGALLGLSAEDLFLEPGDSRFGGFEFSGQLGDLGLLLANDRLELPSLFASRPLPVPVARACCARQ